MAYKTVPGERRVQKNVHMILNLIAFILGVVGICAVFKYHDMMHLQDMYSLHSWIGIITICAYGLQVTVVELLRPPSSRTYRPKELLFDHP